MGDCTGDWRRSSVGAVHAQTGRRGGRRAHRPPRTSGGAEPPDRRCQDRQLPARASPVGDRPRRRVLRGRGRRDLAPDRAVPHPPSDVRRSGSLGPYRRPRTARRDEPSRVRVLRVEPGSRIVARIGRVVRCARRLLGPDARLLCAARRSTGAAQLERRRGVRYLRLPGRGSGRAALEERRHVVAATRRGVAARLGDRNPHGGRDGGMGLGSR